MVVPGKVRYPPEPLEVGENCMPLELEGSDMGATAKYGLCTQTFLLGVRLVDRYLEFNMTSIETYN